jgi:hypothetical protein
LQCLGTICTISSGLPVKDWIMEWRFIYLFLNPILINDTEFLINGVTENGKIDLSMWSLSCLHNVYLKCK